VIELKESYLTGWNCAHGRCFGNAIYISFNRDTEHLDQITYDYLTHPECKGINLLGLCLGVKGGQNEGQETVYNKSDHGPFLSFLLNSNPITNLQDPIIGVSEYDYRITSASDKPFESIEIIEFHYTLTDEEVAAVNSDIQEQFNNELHKIIANPDITYEERDTQHKALLKEYEEYTIDYGESLRSLCENENLCHIESEYQAPDMSWAHSFIDSLKEFLTAIVIGLVFLVIILTIGVPILNDLFQSIITLIIQSSQGIAIGIYEYLWIPFYNGLKTIIISTLSLVFWRSHE
jgi:hypothetical protein